VTERWLDYPFGLDPTEHDPGAWGASLLYNAELVIDVLDVAGGASITEVGALHGDLTRLLLQWAKRSAARVSAVDPMPPPELEAPSHDALAHIPLSETVIIDGDHNYFTVAEELRIISQRAEQERRILPLLLLHDVGWPHGRRDDYFVPERIPAEHRQPIAPEAGLYPGDPDTRSGGLPYHYPAAHEGGPRNGVLTAVEDFVAAREQRRLAIIPSFFGMGLVWDTSAAWSEPLTELLAPWDRNEHLQRLEHNRVVHLANTLLQLSAVRAAEGRLEAQGRRLAQQRELLSRIAQSRAFWAVERFLRSRNRDPTFSREAIRRVLDGTE
jgi:hypothetical protein